MTEPSVAKLPPERQGFSSIPHDAFGHFVLNVFEAIIAVIDFLDRLFPPDPGGSGDVMARVPFLQHYADELSRVVPAQLDWRAMRHWWRAELTGWEAQAAGVHLPLRDLVTEAGVSRQARQCFVLAGLVEEESRFGTLFASLQSPLPGRRPTVEIIGQIAEEADVPSMASGWVMVEGLVRAGYLRAEDTERARSEWTLAVPSAVWDAARSTFTASAKGGVVRLAASGFGPVDALDLPEETLSRLSRIPRMAAGGGTRFLVLRSQPGGDAQEVAGSIARALGRDLLVAEAASAKETPAVPVGPVAALCRAVPFLTYDLGPGETAAPPPLAGFAGLAILSLGHEGSVDMPKVGDLTTIALTTVPPDLRRRMWARLLPGTDRAELDAIAERFRIGGGHIRRAAPLARNEAALEGRRDVSASDVRAATRALGRESLETHAIRMQETGAGWDGLICGSTTSDKLSELERRCHHRETLPDHLGRGFLGNASRGVRALFTGKSGTGKTYATRILASEIGRDLYRVDLASVINKYIGETEKNLHQVLAHAEALDIVLLLDEGDSLLGRRTDVKSSNDRYANLETNYLLQRLETYEGILVVTTNLGDAIDSAFQRRMDVVVPFQVPNAEERRRILTLHLPDNHTVAEETVDRVAIACQITGAQVRNAVMHAGLMALDEGSRPIADRHLLAALASEYRKAGSVFPLGGRGVAPRHGGLEGFVSALTEV